MDEGTGSFRYGGEIGQSLNYRVYGMGFADDPEFHSNHDEFDAWQLGQAGFRTDWSRQDRDTFTLQGDLYNGSEGQLVSVCSYSPPGTLNLPGPVLVSGGNLLGRWERKLKTGSDLQIQTYYDRTSRLSPQLGEIRNTFDVDLLYHLTLKWKQDVLLGAGGRWSPDDIIQHVPTLNFLPAHETDRIFSWFRSGPDSRRPGARLADPGVEVRIQQLFRLRHSADGAAAVDPDDTANRSGQRLPGP